MLASIHEVVHSATQASIHEVVDSAWSLARYGRGSQAQAKPVVCLNYTFKSKMRANEFIKCMNSNTHEFRGFLNSYTYEFIRIQIITNSFMNSHMNS